MGASWATVAVGVMGDTGGRSEVGDSERFCEAAEVDEAPLEEAGRRSVLTSSAGMAEGEVSGRGAQESSAAISDGPPPRGWRGSGLGARRPGRRAQGDDTALLTRCAPRLCLPWSRAGAWLRCYGEEVTAPALRPFVERELWGLREKQSRLWLARPGLAEDSERLRIVDVPRRMSSGHGASRPSLHARRCSGKP